MKPLKIGNLKLKNRLFLAPMVDVTDVAYRVLCRKAGAAIGYTEMLYADAILHARAKQKVAKIMKFVDDERPIGLQVTGSSVGEFEKLARVKELGNYDLIDVNCGCPSSRITGNEAGSYLLKTPSKIGEMISALKKEHEIVTAKIRLGFNENNCVEVAKKVEKAGADLLTVHCRLARQKNSEPADWKWLAKIKREIGIPVVGNGGVVSGESAAEMLDIADGAMVASAAIGNPLIFREILRYLKTGKEKEISSEERIGEFRKYLELAKKYDVVDFGRIKYVGGSFLKGFDGAAKKRGEFMKCKSFGEVREFVGAFNGGLF